MFQIKIFDIDLGSPEQYTATINEWLAGLGEDVELVETKFTPYIWREDNGAKSPYMTATIIYKTKSA